MNDFRTRTTQEPRQPEVAVCETCRSEYFYEVQIHRYAADAYSAVLGGELRAIEEHAPKSIRICIAGHPVVPVISGGRVGRAATEAESVISAVKGAVQMQNKVVSDIVALTKGMASHNSLQELAARTKALEGLVGTKRETPVEGKKARKAK